MERFWNMIRRSCNKIIKLDFLSQLESLKLVQFSVREFGFNFPPEFKRIGALVSLRVIQTAME